MAVRVQLRRPRAVGVVGIGRHFPEGVGHEQHLMISIISIGGISDAIRPDGLEQIYAIGGINVAIRARKDAAAG